MTDNTLYEYKQKRDFEKTQEPVANKKKEETLREKYGTPLFVIQKHNASSLHYDLRLEIDGALKSWAIPKGPSTDPGEKRLAIETEDHPIAYALFEGIIPEDHYGAGSVLVWDIGTYSTESEDSLKDQYEQGRIEFFLQGEKLTGGYALIQAKLGNKDENWLLVKTDDEHADARRNPTTTETKSVLSGKTTEEIEEAFNAKDE